MIIYKLEIKILIIIENESNQFDNMVKTNQMHDMLVYDGHMYQYCKPNVADDYYRCCQSRSKVMAKCSASINISKDKTKEPTAHNHLKQSASAPIVKRLRNITKLRVINDPKNKPNTILLEEVGKSCREDNLEIDDGSKLIPNYNGFKRSLYRYRNKVKPIEPLWSYRWDKFDSLLIY